MRFVEMIISLILLMGTDFYTSQTLICISLLVRLASFHMLTGYSCCFLQKFLFCFSLVNVGFPYQKSCPWDGFACYLGKLRLILHFRNTALQSYR